MIRRPVRSRSGITLTEILISILILGIGVISLATLFPIGLVRLRKAQQLTRGAYLVESASADLGSRNLLAQQSFFKNPISSPWYSTTVSGYFNPWVQDTPSYGADWSGGATRVGTPGVGLPVAYDPLFRYVTGVYPDPIGASTYEARFGDGFGSLRADPNPIASITNASAYGLQRISNFQATYTGNAVALQTANAVQVARNNLAVLQTFISPEDLVLQDAKGIYSDPNNAGSQMTSPSPIVPDMSGGTPVNEWRFSWFFTGSQSDSSNGSIFDGEIVVCESRPFGIDKVSRPFGGNSFQVSGETVVEAVWGYTATPDPLNVGYGSPSANRSVLLRWPSTLPDPDVKTGSWIADVTYERSQPVAAARFTGVYPGQRCYWYQVAKKTDPVPDPGFPGDPGNTSFRRMTVTVSSPLRALTPLIFSTNGSSPYHVESALIMPSVVNVYPRTVYTR